MSLNLNTKRIYADTNYRLPVFKINAEQIVLPNGMTQTAKSVRISNLNYSTDFFNVSYNNNVIRWIRKLNDTITPSGWTVDWVFNTETIIINGENISNETPIPKSIPLDNLATLSELNNYLIDPVNDNFKSEYYVLCQLYIDPNIYSTTVDIINNLNNKFEKSIDNLVNINSVYSSMIEMNYASLLDYFKNNYPTSNATIYVIEGISNTSLDGSTKYLNYTGYCNEMNRMKSTSTDVVTSKPSNPDATTATDVHSNPSTGTTNDSSNPSNTSTETTTDPSSPSTGTTSNPNSSSSFTDLELTQYRNILNPYLSSLINVILNKENTGGANFFIQQEIVDQNTITVKTIFDCIPVSFQNDCISSVKNYLDIYNKYDMFNTFDTIIPSKVLTYSIPYLSNSSKQTYLNTQSDTVNVSAINNINYISEYNKSIESVDSYYYNFSSNSDLWNLFGTDYFTILNDSIIKFDANNDNNPIYIIFGQYYSEYLYKGQILSNNNYYIKDNNQTVNLDRGTDISNLPSNMLSTFITNTHFGRYHINLTIPKELHLNITQNDDVERIVNNMYEISSFINYSLIYTNQPVYLGINQIIEINKSVSFSNNKVLYLYITSDTHTYPISNMLSYIDVEYYN